MSKLLYRLSALVLVSAFLLIVYFGYMLLWPFNPVTLHSDPFPTDKKVYRHGDKLTYTLDFTKHINVPPKISYHLVNGVSYPLTHGGVSRPMGNNKKHLQIVIPQDIPPGRYQLQIDLEYPINPVRKIYRIWQSTSFDILEEVDRK